MLGSHLRSPHWYILVKFNSTLPLARYAQSYYALLVHWGYALHITNRVTCSAEKEKCFFRKKNGDKNILRRNRGEKCSRNNAGGRLVSKWFQEKFEGTR
jgi:hypothetical protein